MAAIDTVADARGLNITARDAISKAFWLWFYNNPNEKVQVKVWFVNVDVPISKLRPLFVMLFGEDPVARNG
jgi:hypothetical protein